LPLHLPQLRLQRTDSRFLLLLARPDARQVLNQILDLAGLDDEVAGELTLSGGEGGRGVWVQCARVRGVGVFGARIEGAGRGREGVGVVRDGGGGEERVTLREVASCAVELRC
jgi:hypothetical protein